MASEQTTEIKFFAASNSSHGFQNYFQACFGEGSHVDRLYIIKGGPGTGKSYLMRTVGREATAHGYAVTHYYCSSDPTSLDGIICSKEGRPCIGILDGTAPHVWEPRCPGVQEEIINLGDFWDSCRLIKQADAIKKLTAEKSACYAMAYRLLSACGDTDAVIETLVEPCIFLHKLTRLAERILKEQPTGKGYREVPALLDAVGMTGKIHFATFEHLACTHPRGNVLYIENYHGVGYRLMDGLRQEAERKKLELWVSRHPVFTKKIAAVYIPEGGLCIMIKEGTTASDRACLHRHIGLRRYVDADAMHVVRQKIRSIETLRDNLLARAIEQLQGAAVHHFALEEIYASAMDFDAKNSYEEALCQRIFTL